MSHWASPLIGCKWVFGAEGPREFDCWGFVRFVQMNQFSTVLPHIPYQQDWRETAQHLKQHKEHDNWMKVESPDEGDVVMMARSRLPIHIGVWISANGTMGVLHCLEGAGVLFQPASTLRSAGWGKLEFYRHR